MQNYTFFYVNAHAGAGKTKAAHELIVRNRDMQFAIATQTNALSNQQCSDLIEMGREARVISHENAVTNCTKRFARHCKESPHIVPIVNESVALQDLDGTKGHHLIVDEYVSPVRQFNFREDLEIGQMVLCKLFCSGKRTELDGYVELTSNHHVKEIAEESQKTESMLSRLEDLRKVCGYIESPHWRVFVKESAFNNLANPNGTRQVGEEQLTTLRVYAFLLPSVLANYASVTFMGANFNRSKLYLCWRSMVNFEPHPEIKDLRYEDFSHKADKIKIGYMSEKPVSMTRLQKIGYENFIASVAGAVEAAYPTTPYIYTINKRAPNSYWTGTNGERLSPNPMGLNGYLHYNMAVHAATLNPSKDDEAFWGAFLNVTREELRASQAYEMQYQFVTRTSIRDGKTASLSEEIVAIVLDRCSADALCEVLGVEGPSIKLEVPALSGYQAPPRKARSDKKPPKSIQQVRAEAAERQRRSRAKRRGIATDNFPNLG